jgi:hypothetical protein
MPVIATRAVMDRRRFIDFSATGSASPQLMKSTDTVKGKLAFAGVWLYPKAHELRIRMKPAPHPAATI